MKIKRKKYIAINGISSTNIAKLFRVLILLISVLSVSNIYGDTISRVDDSGIPKIEKKVFFRVGGDESYPPYEFINKDGKPDGFNVELFKELAKMKNINYEITLFSDAKATTYIECDSIDLLIGYIFLSGGELPYEVSNPSIYLNYTIVTPSNSEISEISDLRGKKIAIIGDWKSSELLSYISRQNTVLGITDIERALQLLNDDKYDALICYRRMAQYFINKNNLSNVNISDVRIEERAIGFASKSKYEATIQLLDSALIESKSNGIYDRVYNKWFPATTKKYDGILNGVLAGMVGLALIAIFFTIIIILLKKKVHKATNQIVKQNQQLSLAIRAGEISVWCYNKKEDKFYNLEGNSIPSSVVTFNDMCTHIHPEDLKKYTNAMDIISKGVEQMQEVTFRFRYTHSPDWIYVQTQLTASKNDDNHIISVLGTYKNITDSYQHQKRLEESQMKTELAMKVSDMVQWDYDAFAGIFTVGAEEPYNIFAGYMSGNAYKHAVHPDDLPKVEGIFNIMDNGRNEEFKVEFRIKFSSETSWNYISISGTPVHADENGKIIRYSGFRRDMTDWYLLTEELSRQNDFNRTIIESLSSGLVYLNERGIVLWENVNEKFGDEVTGGETLFKVGEHCAFTHGKAKIPCDECLIEIIRKSKKQVQIEKKLCNGGTIEITANPMIGSDGKFKGAVFRVENITLRKKLYDDLEMSRNKALRTQELLADILDRIPCSIFIKDVNDNFKYIVANQLFCVTANLAKNEVIGKTDVELYSEAIATQYKMTDLRTMENHTVVIEEDTIVNGHNIYWQTTKSLLETSDGHKLIVGLGVNLTDIHNVNNQLMVAKEKAEESDKLKSAFLANMSHEIRTPLNAIVGFSDMLLKTTDEEERQLYAGIISSNNELLLRLINDILDLSKIDASAIELHMDELDLVPFFQEIIFSLQQRLTNPNVKLQLSNIYKSCVVVTDRSRLAQVVNNFASNAIKYTEKGLITVGYENNEKGIKIYVSDTGKGIPDDKKCYVFGRFQKLDKFAQGTGLGLSICKALVEMIGGTVGFESQEGAGSTFWAQLPIFPTVIEIDPVKIAPLSEPVLPQNPALSSAKSNKKTELGTTVKTINIVSKPMAIIVDEDGTLYNRLKSVMNKGFNLLQANNAKNALSIIKRGGISLIIIDIINEEVLQWVRSIREYDNKISIIGVISEGQELHNEEAINAGCNELLQKPLDNAEVKEIMKHILENK